MNESTEILIADRNPRIRRFLKRELTAAGYRVRLVDNGKELLQLVYSGLKIDLLILDPDFPCRDAIDLSRKITARIPQLPVVLHSVRSAEELQDFGGGHIVHIEKNGNSVELLKETIHTILAEYGHAKPLVPQA